MIIAVLNPVEVLTSVRNCVQNCDDQGLLDFKIRSSIYETFHISLHNSSVGWNCSLKLSVLPLMTEALRYSFLILSSIFFYSELNSVKAHDREVTQQAKHAQEEVQYIILY